MPVPGPTLSVEDARGSRAIDLLAELEDALAAGSRDEVVSLAAPTPEARRTAGFLWSNARALRVRKLSLRYVDELAGAVGSRRWVAEVQVSYLLAGADQAPTRLEVALTVQDTPAGTRLVAFGGHDDRTPLWMQTPLEVRRSGSSLVMVARATGSSTTNDVRELARMARTAVRVVRRVLPQWDGALVVEVPGSQEELDAMIGAAHGKYDAVAALTTTVDGTLTETSPVHVMVNPAVFDGLGPSGAQVVLSHEATHVATHAATAASMPLWLMEGFADYVALRDTTLPDSITAGQILSAVRRNGPPGHLPGVGEFDPSGSRFGASYESAWLANRYLAERFGQKALVDFYHQVDGGTPASTAFRRDLGIAQRAFVQGWRGYLRRLAG